MNFNPFYKNVLFWYHNPHKESLEMKQKCKYFQEIELERKTICAVYLYYIEQIPAQEMISP